MRASRSLLRSASTLIFAAAIWSAICRPAAAERKEDPPPETEGVGYTDLRDAQIHLQMPFVEANGKQGKPVTLADIFDGSRPVLLTLNYSDCPRLCHEQLNGLVAALRKMPWDLGDQYAIVTVSIDPLETPQRAWQTKEKYLAVYDRPGTADGWHFLVGEEKNVKELARTVGFRYRYMPKTKEYNHVAVLMVCTPEGRVSRYIGGITFDPQTVRLSLFEAGEGKIGSAMDQVLLYCFTYDPTTGRYAPVAVRIMQLGGALTVLLLGGMLSLYWLRERRKSKSTRAEPEESA